ncbi:Eco57I restriction-modification methylase domain-containing protein [Psychrilyobacter sp.]|uniref:Eco57I restriction-modification methylase domain-containing protein n=1 Tax=Psychrilyobacter sp. TaxID=2586924 RepID=UPI003018062F
MNKIKELVKQFQDNMIYVKKPEYNETSLRQHYLDKLFENLGWDIANNNKVNPEIQEVILEPYDKKYKRPDYAFTFNGIKKFFLEAKKPSVSIINNKKVIFQAKSYGWSANHPIVVISNFETLIIYDTTSPPKIDDHYKNGVLYEYNYLEYEEKWDEIHSLLSRGSIFSGEFDTKFSNNKDNLKLYSIDKYFLTEINNWRLKLGKYLYEEKKYNTLKINESIQKFINQIIFLRFCEDRNLNTYHSTMQNFSENKEKLKEQLKLLFIAADFKYNSGLFDGKNIIFDLSNEIIFDIVNKLYYPNSPYMFDAIDSNILGDIYELFLSEKIELVDNKIILAKKDEDINKSIVTTPQEIVKYMVETSLEEKIDNKNFNEILNLNIADIACGSGIFLVAVYEKIQNYLIKKYMKEDPTKLVSINLNQYKLNFFAKRSILENCIFGIDIDFNAVEVAKFSLLLKLLENENSSTIGIFKSILPSLNKNIKNGNSLINLENLSEKEYNKLSLPEKIKLVPFQWDFKGNIDRFDLILCNPPYVKTEDMKKHTLDIEMKMYKKYFSAYKQFDKYFLFIEKALKNIKEDGKICFIIPNKFIKNEAGRKLRELLIGDYSLEKYIDFNSIQLFKDQTTYSSILIASKNKNSEFDYEAVANLQDWLKTKGTKFVKVKKSILSKDPWIICSDKKEIDLLNKLYEDSFLLDDIADAINGIQTSAEKNLSKGRPYPLYWFSKSEILKEDNEYIEIKRGNKTYKIEKTILKPYFKPTTKIEKKISSFDVPTLNKWIIFPYDKNGVLYSLNLMEGNYPETLKYLKDHYDMLIPKQISGDSNDRDVPISDKHTWYHYGRIQGLTSFIETPKLIVKVMAKDNPLYLLDVEDMIISSGGTAGYCAIESNSNSPYDLEFIQAILTHPAIDWLFSKMGSNFEGGFYTRGTNVLKRVPIKKLNLEIEEEKMKYDKIISLIKQIKKCTNFIKQDLSQQEIDIHKTEKVVYLKRLENEISNMYMISDFKNIYRREQTK